jgi:hypothetical protein
LAQLDKKKHPSKDAPSRLGMLGMYSVNLFGTLFFPVMLDFLIGLDQDRQYLFAANHGRLAHGAYGLILEREAVPDPALARALSAGPDGGHFFGQILKRFIP